MERQKKTVKEAEAAVAAMAEQVRQQIAQREWADFQTHRQKSKHHNMQRLNPETSKTLKP
jgi:hypothetical protein